MTRDRRRGPLPLAPEQAREKALAALSRREHSARELRRKLIIRGAEPALAGETVDDLAEAGWQSDARYAELVARARAAQGYGPLRVRAELGARGVARERIEAALDALDADWAAAAANLLQRRYRDQAADAQARASRYRYLASRGYTGRQIAQAFAAFGDALDEVASDDDLDPGDLLAGDDDSAS